MAMTPDELYASRIFLNAALPLAKVIAIERPKLNKCFLKKNVILQVSAMDGKDKLGTHFIVDKGEWTVVKGTHEKPDVELLFGTIPHFNAFFAGKTKKLPKIKGFSKIGSLVGFLMILLKMAALLQSSDVPSDAADAKLLVKLYYYLLPAGISQLNKAGHPAISAWAKKSPDRVYAFSVKGEPNLQSFIRVKAGNTRSGHGAYLRAKPFFTMSFDCINSALGILLQKDDMIESTAQSKLIMEGAPEFGGQIGEFMMIIAGYAK